MNAPADQLEQKLTDAFGEDAAELDHRAREVSGLDPVEMVRAAERVA